MRDVRYLSYPYLDRNPAYGQGLVDLNYNQCKSISCGDSCNTYDFSMNNHLGTHVDAPAHFFENEKSISNIDPSRLCFDEPELTDVEINKDEYLVYPQHLVNKELSSEMDILIIRTGFYKKRYEEDYCKSGLGMSAELGSFLREHFKNLRAVILDTISLSSFQNREAGRESHKVFLKPESPILIVEDANLQPLEELGRPKQIVIAPLLLGFADSAPCTVMGFWNNEGSN